MSTAVQTDTETSPLDRLELPCEVQFDDFKCQNRAEWLGYSSCCRQNNLLACSNHKEQYRMSHPPTDRGLCLTCGKVIVFRDSVLWEKL